MHELNLMDAFASYSVKPTRRARSAMTSNGELVISCRYGGFKKARIEILKYEEDLSGQSSEDAMALRGHLAAAISNECEVRVIVAVEASEPKADSAGMVPARARYYARKDLLGRVSFFDGQRFVLEFHRVQTLAEEERLSKGALATRRMS